MATSALRVDARVPSARPVTDISTVYADWFRTVYRWCRSLGGPSADAEDLVQEIFVIVQRRLRDFDGVTLGGWLYGITRKVVADHRRRAWVRRVILGKTPEQLDTDGEEHLERKQERQRFYRVVDRMADKYRQPFVLFEVVGHTTEEIATLLALPPATVRVRLHRARKQFLELLGKDDV